MTHFSDGDLQQWGSSGPGDDRARVIAHLSVCPSCATRYAEAIRAGMAGATPASAEESVPFVERAYDIPSHRPTVLPFPMKRRWIVSTAAAAAVIAAIATPYLMRLRTPANDEMHFRGGSIHPLEPVGAVDRGADFGWSSDIAAPTYRLEIGDATGVVLARDTTGPRVGLTPDAWEKLTPGVDYWWSVTALDAAGRRLTSSPRVRFTIRAR